MPEENYKLSEVRQRPLSRADLRKFAKPLMEKKRRARINASLVELKSLVLDAMYRRDTVRYSKLEKADVLDMAVNYLKSQQERQMTAVLSADPGVADQFWAGYLECAEEVGKHLGNVHEVSAEVSREVRSRLLRHLSSRCLSRRHRSEPATVRQRGKGTVPTPLTTPSAAPAQALFAASFKDEHRDSEKGHEPPGSRQITDSRYKSTTVQSNYLTDSIENTHLHNNDSPGDVRGCAFDNTTLQEQPYQGLTDSTVPSSPPMTRRERQVLKGGVSEGSTAPLWRPW